MNRNSSSAKTLRRVLGELEGQKHLVVLSFLLALASVAGTLFVPILVGRAIDEIVGPALTACPTLHLTLSIFLDCASLTL